MYVYDVVIIGAGPAGLAAAARIGDETNRFLLMDAGKALEDRDRYLDVADGVAGAGLYSDGKHSFFPSATKLWQLRNRDLLKDAYKWTAAILTKHGLPNVPSFPSSLTINEKNALNYSWEHKPYPSGYLSLDARMKLAKVIWNSLRGDLSLSTRLENWIWDESKELFDLEIEFPAGRKVVQSKFLIFSGGRLSPLEILRIHSHTKNDSTIREKFFRIEVGVRIEMEHTAEFFSRMKGIDPKYIMRTELDGFPLEFRTFCCCRRGEIISSNCCGIVSVSGRADVIPTLRSNIGFNVRLLRCEQRIAEELFEKLQKCKEPFSISLADVLSKSNTHQTFISVYGEQLSRFLVFGLRKLSEEFPSLLKSTEGKLVGPCIEGVGMYPDTDDDLRIILESNGTSKSRCFVAGDANGKFRGIVAAFISGRYVASCIAEDLQRENFHPSEPSSKL